MADHEQPPEPASPNPEIQQEDALPSNTPEADALHVGVAVTADVAIPPQSPQPAPQPLLSRGRPRSSTSAPRGYPHVVDPRAEGQTHGYRRRMPSPMDDPDPPAQHQQLDAIQAHLDAVTRRLVHPAFLSNLTPSRLPSPAVSSSSSMSSARDEGLQPSQQTNQAMYTIPEMLAVPQSLQSIAQAPEEPTRQSTISSNAGRHKYLLHPPSRRSRDTDAALSSDPSCSSAS